MKSRPLAHAVGVLIVVYGLIVAFIDVAAKPAAAGAEIPGRSDIIVN